jgi:hypothetical protein
LAGEGKLFYVYDTLQNTGDIETQDHGQHRDLYANVAKRSRFFMVAAAKVNLHSQTHGQVEVPFRYFEGAAAGGVLLGQSLDCDSFREMFNWPDSVIDVEPDGSDVVETLRKLASQPEVLCQISRRNAAEALLRHDWVYRWKQILAIAGFESTPAMEARIARLQELAALTATGGPN